MKTKPILFSMPMVKAILEGSKTQTRRIVKDTMLQENENEFDEEQFLISTIKKYVNIGDVLWVRETFCPFGDDFIYKANPLASDLDVKWKPSIFMPKEACRLFLEVTNVRVERLQGITENDAIAEGVIYDEAFKSYSCYLCDKKGHKSGENLCEDGFFDNAFESFRSLWHPINGKESWNQNPLVWVYEFKQVAKPKDFLL